MAETKKDPTCQENPQTIYVHVSGSLRWTPAAFKHLWSKNVLHSTTPVVPLDWTAAWLTAPGVYAKSTIRRQELTVRGAVDTGHRQSLPDSEPECFEESVPLAVISVHIG